MQQDVLSIIEKVAPDIMETLRERYQILRNIYLLGPVGRRVLAGKMNVTERVLRTETDFLKKQNIIKTSKVGMELTVTGEDVYHELDQMMGQLLGMREKEKELATYFQIEHCIIVSGDSEEQRKVMEELGHATSESLDFLLPSGDNIIAVMGGTTMAKVADQMTKALSNDRHLIFVPARGGIGEAVNIQANTISSQMAENTGGENRVLYVPEQVSEETYKPLLQEPAVFNTLKMVTMAKCVLHSIGDAKLMAERRGMSEEALALIKEQAAVGEAFGYFFNKAGEVVYKIPRIGLQLKDLAKIPCVLAIAGGRSKATAIEAYMKNAPSQTWLITDEGAANQILKGVTL
ncbi:SorC family transcriptional regulator [Carnobacterium divergens]|uniref:sugar-binding transcriptional regulator n=1 Tax=Carnobacterium divergens TaxID=2748 RepID=UPI00107255B0|nr:sugar-binding domain-containing protein [Carnobacterium divergens]MDT1995708.1 sugar-binding domain-containing protein [Carnobacterium divergens]TFI72880.1 SorC family transcriptional regulator [Carnobacterium divergens]TFI85462.1 SorC family transcriptional regulator [Carnobacterium divergens]TFI93199.1 SorC family transcriptional regulator [Carnobacterium divergens]TFI94028.1 SorC family transcriptional regulator [Carnobacterium divergens]